MRAFAYYIVVVLLAIALLTGCQSPAGSAASGKLQVIPSVLPAAIEGHGYSYQLRAAGGTPPYIWTLVAGSLPSGITLTTGGVLVGVPNSVLATETFSFSVQVKDSSTPN